MVVLDDVCIGELDNVTDDISTPSNTNNLKVHIDFYKYENSVDVLLSDVDFTANGKDVVLIKGASGIGKSTMVDIIMGFLKFDKAIVIKDDIDLSRIPDKMRWENMLLVDQESFLFEGTILENLVLGDAISEDDVNTAL